MPGCTQARPGMMLSTYITLPTCPSDPLSSRVKHQDKNLARSRLALLAHLPFLLELCSWGLGPSLRVVFLQVLARVWKIECPDYQADNSRYGREE